MTRLVKPGFMLQQRWEHIADTYVEVGMLEVRPDIESFLYFSDTAVLPHWFYKALTGAVLFVLLLVSILLYQKVRNMELPREVEKRRVAEKQREHDEELKRLKLQQLLVRDIHDGLGGIATSLSFTAILARKEKDVAKRDNWLEKLERLAAEANIEVRDLMNSLEESTLKWADLTDSIRRSSEVIFDPLKTTVELDISNMPVEDDIGLVEGMSIARLVREAMNNIAKHAGASLAKVSMMAEDDHVRISIADNGCGFDPATVQRGRGLNNLARRTAELGGVFEIKADNGTSLSIVILRPVRIVVESGESQGGERI
jgi:signal transduction histidine kinase